ncbi:TlpA family protein disulfide reductase [Aureivirga sp. CE67]|uniref:TlpA family protein disulfide reductase n=1 Tax=Aureivirga sp. CE67 TaxID=1788983 RepID=UPI0018CB738F|nr:TlpA disulfide reductase family protein [Aureivirga sp. CE67]
MKKYLLFIPSIFIIACSSNSAEKKENTIPKTCTVFGNIPIYKNDTLLLQKSNKDLRYDLIAKIPVDSLGNFSYKMDSIKHIEKYELVSSKAHQKGYWVPLKFYTEQDSIEFNYNGLNFVTKEKNIHVISGKISPKEYSKNAFFEPLFEPFDKIDNEIDSLYIELTETKDIVQKNKIQPKIDSLKKHYKKLSKEADLKIGKYYTSHVDLYGYSNLIDILRFPNKYFESNIQIMESVSFYQKKFPDHPYTEVSSNMLNGILKAIKGGSFIDLTVENAEGKHINLKEIVKNNQYTLIDLWAPWCGPCIEKSNNMKPVYEKHKNNGFAVFSVMGGISNRDKYDTIVKKHNYPWAVIPEIKDQYKIWEKYNITGSGGSQFLVDDTGKIIEINPSPELIDKLIQKNKIKL